MLFIIDMQNDYVDKDSGAHIVEEASTIVPTIIQEIKKAEASGEPIYYTLDQHDTKNEERSRKGLEWGLELYPPLKQALKNHIAINKKFHSISPESASELRKQHQDSPDKTIKIVGVETNVCVISNAIMLHNSFPLSSIHILEDMCIGTTEKLHQEALNVMKSLKMEIKTSSNL